MREARSPAGPRVYIRAAVVKKKPAAGGSSFCIAVKIIGAFGASKERSFIYCVMGFNLVTNRFSPTNYLSAK